MTDAESRRVAWAVAVLGSLAAFVIGALVGAGSQPDPELDLGPDNPFTAMADPSFRLVQLPALYACIERIAPGHPHVTSADRPTYPILDLHEELAVVVFTAPRDASVRDLQPQSGGLLDALSIPVVAGAAVVVGRGADESEIAVSFVGPPDRADEFDLALLGMVWRVQGWRDARLC